MSTVGGEKEAEDVGVNTKREPSSAGRDQRQESPIQGFPGLVVFAMLEGEMEYSKSTMRVY